MRPPDESRPGRRVLWLTVSDREFFPGTVAAVNSIRHYHPGAEVAVVSSDVYNAGLTDPQTRLLRAAGVAVYPSAHFARPGRVPGAWQLKAYAAADLSAEADMVVGIDSDAVLCGGVGDVIDACFADGRMRGGRDGDGIDYDESYAPYGFRVPARSEKYMSTSLYFVPLTAHTRRILRAWAACCDTAVFGPQPVKTYPGHGDQGVLNAVAFRHGGDRNVELLDNHLFSQHWVYLSDVIAFEDGALVNRTAGRPQRALHCGGADKFWSAAHSRRLPVDGQNQTWSYAHWLRMLWFGEATDWTIDPALWIGEGSHHLWRDLVHYYHLIEALDPAGVRSRWAGLTDALLARMTDGIPRAMSLGTSMTQYIRVARAVPEHGRVVEVGGYHGGSVVTLAIALLDRNVDVTSVESFQGNGDGTVDGHPLSRPAEYLANVKDRYPHLNIRTYHLDSVTAARRVPDGSLDLVFIDGNHEADAVVRDIDVWWPKLRPGGTLAGDDIGWEGVRAAVERRFGSGYAERDEVWWTARG